MHLDGLPSLERSAFGSKSRSSQACACGRLRNTSSARPLRRDARWSPFRLYVACRDCPNPCAIQKRNML
jgi:hypothetical protein